MFFVIFWTALVRYTWLSNSSRFFFRQSVLSDVFGLNGRHHWQLRAAAQRCGAGGCRREATWISAVLNLNFFAPPGSSAAQPCRPPPLGRDWWPPRASLESTNLKPGGWHCGNPVRFWDWNSTKAKCEHLHSWAAQLAALVWLFVRSCPNTGPPKSVGLSFYHHSPNLMCNFGVYRYTGIRYTSCLNNPMSKLSKWSQGATM